MAISNGWLVMVIVGELATINSKDQLSEYLRRIHDGW